MYSAYNVCAAVLYRVSLSRKSDTGCLSERVSLHPQSRVVVVYTAATHSKKGKVSRTQHTASRTHDQSARTEIIVLWPHTSAHSNRFQINYTKPPLTMCGDNLSGAVSFKCVYI